MQNNKIFRKYNIVINILFWFIVAALLSALLYFYISPDFRQKFSLFQKGEEAETEKKPVVVTEYKEIEKKYEWYYFIATAYSKNDATQGTDSVTSTGEKVREGIIAVDPAIIPYGTLIEIKSMGYFTAEDCGNKIKGNRIDIYFDSKEDALKFGRQGIWVRFVNSSPLMLAELLEKSKQSFK